MRQPITETATGHEGSGAARTACLILALGVIAFTVYGSLMPFRLRERPLGFAWTIFQERLSHPPRRLAFPDFVANLSLFVPIGFGLTGALLLGRRRAFVVPAAVAVLTTGAAVSVGAEFLQVFAPGRFPSRYDLIAQTIGCAIGIGAWLAAGPSTTRWLRAAAATVGSDPLSRVLTWYVLLWVFVNLAPFNVTYDVEEIGRRVRNGRISLLPFGAYDHVGLAVARDALITMICAVPLGWFGLIAWRPRKGRHGLAPAFGVAAALVLAMEVAHIFIRAHVADPADVFFGWTGVLIGVVSGGTLLQRWVDAEHQENAL